MDESITKHLDAPANLSRLSTAARIGARLHPQLIGTAQYAAGGCTCFFGAVAAARGWDLRLERLYEFVEHEERKKARDAYGKAYASNIDWDIYTGVPREQIADRMEAIGY